MSAILVGLCTFPVKHAPFLSTHASPYHQSCVNSLHGDPSQAMFQDETILILKITSLPAALSWTSVPAQCTQRLFQSIPQQSSRIPYKRFLQRHNHDLPLTNSWHTYCYWIYVAYHLINQSYLAKKRKTPCGPGKQQECS